MRISETRCGELRVSEAETTRIYIEWARCEIKQRAHLIIVCSVSQQSTWTKSQAGSILVGFTALPPPG